MGAAHCNFDISRVPIYGYPPMWRPDEILVRVGAHDFSNAKHQGTEHKVKIFHNHPNYQNRTDHDYDFTIYELETQINLDPQSAMAVYLPTKADKDFPEHTPFAVSG